MRSLVPAIVMVIGINLFGKAYSEDRKVISVVLDVLVVFVKIQGGERGGGGGRVERVARRRF